MKVVGFRTSKIDSCSFIRNDCICISCVENIVVFATRIEVIKKLIVDLKGRGADDSRIELTQRSLTSRIVEASDFLDLISKTHRQLMECYLKMKMASEGKFNYASILGMLTYLQGHSYPDILFAVS